MTFERYHPGKRCFFCAFLQNNSIKSPEEFIGKYVEIVILPYDEPEDEGEQK